MTAIDAVQTLIKKRGYVVVGVLHGPCRAGMITTEFASGNLPDGKVLRVTEKTNELDWAHQRLILKARVESSREQQKQAQYWRAVLEDA